MASLIKRTPYSSFFSIPVTMSNTLLHTIYTLIFSLMMYVITERKWRKGLMLSSPKIKIRCKKLILVNSINPLMLLGYFCFFQFLYERIFGHKSAQYLEWSFVIFRQHRYRSSILYIDITLFIQVCVVEVELICRIVTMTHLFRKTIIFIVYCFFQIFLSGSSIHDMCRLL